MYKLCTDACGIEFTTSFKFTCMNSFGVLRAIVAVPRLPHALFFSRARVRQQRTNNRHRAVASARRDVDLYTRRSLEVYIQYSEAPAGLARARACVPPLSEVIATLHC